MRTILGIVVFAYCLGIQSYAMAELPSVMEPPIKAGTMISVDKYEPKSKTYQVTITKEPSVGPNVAMPGDLVDAISTLDSEKLSERPESVVGNTYSLDKELRLISEKGVKLRTQLLSKNKK